MFRKAVVKAGLAAMMVSLIAGYGCSKSSEEEKENAFVFFNWWTSAGERAALAALVEVYKAKKPGVLVENATETGGAGTGRDRLYENLKAGDAPDTYQLHVGDEVKPDLPYLDPISSLYTKNKWADVMPARLVESATFNGERFAVPLDIHRSNVLWYRTDLVKTPPTTWAEFFTLAEQLKTAGHDVFAFFGDWTAGHIFESILLSHLGPTSWTGLFTDQVSWNSTEVKAAFDTLQQLLTYKKTLTSPPIDWSAFLLQAMKTEAKPAAMTIMGDWFEGDLKASTPAWTPGAEFGWAPSPGTTQFMYLSDCFVLPKGAPHTENAQAWLEVAGSREGQDAFNPLKGSIPARSDADTSKYDAYGKSAISDFGTQTLVPSLAHGALGSPGFKSEYFTIMANFAGGTVTRTEAITQLITACNANGMTCQ
jgi:glucose/mannose transport system substrate-binding protein